MNRASLVYALGGGAGHLTRAIAYARRRLAGNAVTILYTEGAPVLWDPPADCRVVAIRRDATPAEVRALVVAELQGGATELVVDTFPGGLGGELDDETLALAQATTLLRRYVKPLSYPDYEALAVRYDVIAVPYDRDRDEWSADDAPPFRGRTEHVGVLLRPLEIGPGRAAPLAVVGDASELGSVMRRSLPCETVFACGVLSCLPPARAYLATAAGYNTTYELAALGVPFGVTPREKRFDDQFRRADLLGRGVYEPRDVARLLEEAA